MRPALCSLAAVLLALPTVAHAQSVDLSTAIASLAELENRLSCEADIGCTPDTDPSDEELRALVHALHEQLPDYERMEELSDTSVERQVASAVCLVVPREYAVLHDGYWYLPAAYRDHEGVLDLESGWVVSQAYSGLLIEFALESDLIRHAVLTAAHPTTYAQACGSGDGYLFLFGLDELAVSEAMGPTKIVIPEANVVEGACTLVYLKSTLSDVALYSVDSTIAQNFSPYRGDIAEVNAGDEVFAIGHPQGTAKKLTRGWVAEDTPSPLGRRFDTSLYTQDGMSGAPVFRKGMLVGVHASSETLSGWGSDCVACPVPCVLRPQSEDCGEPGAADCYDESSWSTEISAAQLGTIFDLQEIHVDATVLAAFTRLKVERGGTFFRWDPTRQALIEIGNQARLTPRGSVLAHLPSGSRIAVQGRTSGDAIFRWKTFEADDLSRRPKSLLTDPPRRLVVRDPSAGNLELEIGRE